MRPRGGSQTCQRTARLGHPRSSSINLSTSTARKIICRRLTRFILSSLDDLRSELGFKIVGYVLMPEHCHLLFWQGPAANPPQIMQKLSE